MNRTNSNFEQAEGAVVFYVNATAEADSAQANCWVSNPKIGTYTMKKLVISAAFATLLASPAFAQSYNPSFGTGNVNSPNDMMNAGSRADMAMPSYATVQPASAEHLDGVRAEAPQVKRRHTHAKTAQ